MLHTKISKKIISGKIVGKNKLVGNFCQKMWKFCWKILVGNQCATKPRGIQTMLFVQKIVNAVGKYVGKYLPTRFLPNGIVLCEICGKRPFSTEFPADFTVGKHVCVVVNLEQKNKQFSS